MEEPDKKANEGFDAEEVEDEFECCEAAQNEIVAIVLLAEDLKLGLVEFVGFVEID